MSPEQSRENDRNAAGGSQDQSAERVDRADTGLQRLDLNYPQVLTLNGVSSAIVKVVLKELMSEIADVASDYLYDAVKNNHTVSRAKLSEMYFHNTPFTINQTQAFTLGEGGACENWHTVMIVPDGQDDACVVQLQRSITDPGAIDLSFLFTWTPLENRWDWVKVIGSSMGRDDLLALFVRAPAEQIEEYENGLRVTQLTPLISLNTVPPERSFPIHDMSDIVEDMRKRSASWVPSTIYCALPSYSEERFILEMVAPQHHDAAIASGLLRVADNFTRRQTDIRTERLNHIGKKLPIPLCVEFRKRLEIGMFEECDENESGENSHESQGGMSREDAGEPSDSQEREGLETGASYGASEEAPAEGEEQDFVNPVEFDPDVSDEGHMLDPSEPEDGSVVVISGLPSNQGAFSLFYRSGAELNGGGVLRVGEQFNEDAPVFGVEFDRRAKPLSQEQIARRWHLVSRIGTIVGSDVDPTEIQLSLDLGASSDGRRFGVDVLARRLAVYVKK